MAVFNPFDFFLEPAGGKIPFAYDPNERRELVPYLVKAPATPLFAAFLAGVSANAAPHDRLPGRNQPAAGPGHTLPDTARTGRAAAGRDAATRSGSCRDSAALLVQLLRHLGFAARFVSGYLIQLVPDVKPLDGPAGPDKDFTDLHAWCEVYLPGAGWIGLDPTSGLFAGEGHVPLACTPEPATAAPVSRCRGRVRDAVSAQHERAAHLGGAARHQALRRGSVAGHRGLGAGNRRAAAGRRCAPDHGRRTDLRRDRRSRRRGMEHGGAGAQQAPAGRRPVSTACKRRYAPAGPGALRPGQVVPGRAAAALVAELLLAPGRRAAVGQSGAARR